MEGAARVFAGEFCHSTQIRVVPLQESPVPVITPTGARCTLVYIAGVLTETTESGAGLMCRIADPTGAFDVKVTSDVRQDLAGTFRKISVPSFIAVVGRAVITGKNREGPVICADSVQIIGKEVRDAWIARTAEVTLQRIETMARVLQGQMKDEQNALVISHYHITPSLLQDFLAMVESALSSLGTSALSSPEPQQDIRAIVIGIIREQQGARGIAVDDVIAQAATHGIPRDPAKAVIDELIREDECYQPQKGNIRLL